MQGLVLLCERTGKFEHAEQLYNDAWGVYESRIGTKSTVHNMGQLAGRRGEGNVAEIRYTRALDGREETRGKWLQERDRTRQQ